MNDFLQIMEKGIAFIKMKFVIYGHSISFWDIFLWFLVVSILVKVINALFDN